MKELKLQLHRNPQRRCVELFAHLVTPEGDVQCALLDLTEPQPPCETLKPLMDLDDTQCTILLEHLWNAGFRPTNAIDRTETVEAMRAHLATQASEISFLRGMCEDKEDFQVVLEQVQAQLGQRGAHMDIKRVEELEQAEGMVAELELALKESESSCTAALEREGQLIDKLNTQAAKLKELEAELERVQGDAS